LDRIPREENTNTALPSPAREGSLFPLQRQRPTGSSAQSSGRDANHNPPGEEL
jgi:hypothetical protein